MTLATKIGFWLLAAVVALLFVMAFLAAPPAHAAPCAPHATMLDTLKAQYDEELTAAGVIKDGASLMEITVAQSGSWTLLITGADGLSCVAAAGRGFGAAIRRQKGFGQGEPM